MKRFLTTAALGAITMIASVRCEAAIEAYSNINLSNFAVYRWDGATSALGPQLVAGTDLVVVSATFTSGASGNITSIPGGPISTNAADTTPAGLNTLQAYEGGAPVPAEDDFSNVPVPPAVPPFARGDTDGTGAIIAGLGFPTPATAQLVSEAQLTTGVGPLDIGQASSNVQSTAAFTLTVGSTLSTIFDLNVSRNLVADLTPFPPGNSASAGTRFTITITPSGSPTTIFNWAPNGGAGGISGGTEYFDPFDLNAGISGFPGDTSSLSTGVGNFRAAVTLAAGNYSVTIRTESGADVARSEIVPEPISIATWSVLAGLGIGCLVKARRSC